MVQSISKPSVHVVHVGHDLGIFLEVVLTVVVMPRRQTLVGLHEDECGPKKAHQHHDFASQILHRFSSCIVDMSYGSNGQKSTVSLASQERGAG